MGNMRRTGVAITIDQLGDRWDGIDLQLCFFLPALVLPPHSLSFGLCLPLRCIVRDLLNQLWSLNYKYQPSFTPIVYCCS